MGRWMKCLEAFLHKAFRPGAKLDFVIGREYEKDLVKNAFQY